MLDDPPTQRAFSALLVICGVALLRCWLRLLWCPEGAEPLPHRLALGDVPDAAFHLTYAGQLVGLYIAHKIAQVKDNLTAADGNTD